MVRQKDIVNEPFIEEITQQFTFILQSGHPLYSEKAHGNLEALYIASHASIKSTKHKRICRKTNCSSADMFACIAAYSQLM